MNGQLILILFLEKTYLPTNLPKPSETESLYKFKLTKLYRSLQQLNNTLKHIK